MSSAPDNPPSPRSLQRKLGKCLLRDRRRLRGRLRRLERDHRQGRNVRVKLTALAEEIEQAVDRRRERREILPRPTFDLDLPIIEHRKAIAESIRSNQVVVVAGETGSGKSTQLPKICLSIGRGVDGMIAHTQPRRIAARTIAARVADELGASLGSAVGYKVRFSDRTGPGTYVKVLTDGMLLAELRSDRRLEAYDTIIIDEAHERSLNIDYLLGYLRQLLPKRPDLRIIITSATIDTERFAAHFDDAPIIEVSGRTYPVEMRYRPLSSTDADDEDRELPDAIVDAVQECMAAGPGDILAFASGEREIRQAADALRKRPIGSLDVVPLYARLSVEEQNRVFRPLSAGFTRRVVLATNVAETSLTVPGVRFVVDPGEARVSRYSATSQVQRLPVERISQASANQRAGRCGRLGPGVCIRLYTEDDFASREAYTPPEILRSNLAGVILQMISLELGAVEAFPFVDPPKPGMIRAGYRTLHEIGAIDEEHMLTPIGERLAHLPVDPRIGRMLLAADDEACLAEVLVIASALAIQDPRERPHDRADLADEAHAKFEDEQSDFLTLLNVWRFYHEQKEKGSWGRLRRVCIQNFLSFVRMREWTDVHRQLRDLLREVGLRPTTTPAEPANIHRALLTGLLGNIARKERPHEFTGASGRTIFVFPGSVLFRREPAWFMSAEIVETTKLYARRNAPIQPAWLEKLGAHLIKRRYAEPHWSETSARVMAYETITLFGLEIVARRRAPYDLVEPAAARELFIHHALVEGEYQTDAPFFVHNRAIVEEVRELESKKRQRDMLVDPRTHYEFYDARLPADVCSGRTLDAWRRQAERRDPRILFLRREDLLRDDAGDVTAELYPDHLTLNGIDFPLEYNLEPGSDHDGVTLSVPIEALGQLEPARLEWLVPGLIEEKIVALIRSMPKTVRRSFVPAPDYARAVADRIEFGRGSLAEQVGRELNRLTGMQVPPDALDAAKIPAHLNMNVRVLDEAGEELASERDLDELGRRFGARERQALARLDDHEICRRNVESWDFDALPTELAVERAGMPLSVVPALVDRNGAVAIELFDDPALAEQAMASGLRRLVMNMHPAETKHQAAHFPRREQLCLLYAPLGNPAAFFGQLVERLVDESFFPDPARVRTKATFEASLTDGWHRMPDVAERLAAVAEDVLALRQDIVLRLEERTPAQWARSIADVRDHLARLVPPDAFATTPPAWVPHLPRFLRGIGRRLDKLAGGGHSRDDELVETISADWAACFERIDAAEDFVPPAVEHFRWMLEEYRVSLFAQELRTSVPVSAKRLRKLRDQLP